MRLRKHAKVQHLVIRTEIIKFVDAVHILQVVPNCNFCRRHIHHLDILY